MQDVPDRQRTLRNTLAWSYDLLSTHEQRLFRRLCVFVGSFTLEASEAVCNGGQDLELSLLDGLASLLDKSLLYQVEQGAGEPRFVMLETIREYGLECLETSGETIATRRAYSRYYLLLAEQAEHHLSSREQRAWLQCLEQAYSNLRMALSWLIEQAETEMVLRLAYALWHFWWMCGQVIEGCSWLERALELPSQEETGSRALFRSRALSAMGTLAGLQGDLEQAERLCQESLAVSRQLGDVQSIVTALWMLGYVAREKSNYVLARTLAHESLQLARNTHNMPGINYSLETLAVVALDQGSYQEARILIEESLEICRQVGDIWETARSLWLLALALLFQGDIAQAFCTRFLPSLQPGRIVSPHPVSLFRRLFAWVIDAIVIFICPLVIYAIIVSLLISYNRLTLLNTLIITYGSTFFCTCIFVFAFLDFVFFPLVFHGKTVGKQVVAMRLVSLDGTVPRGKQILVRYSVLVFPVTALNLLEALFSLNGWFQPSSSTLSWLLVFLYTAPIFFRSDRQSLGGLVSHTRNAVERRQKEELRVKSLPRM